MATRNLLLRLTALAAALLFQAGAYCLPASAESAALSGQVSSAEEGAMEGVLVSAQQMGSTITITVVSDQQGRYSFPAAKLPPGKYLLSIRAVGYDLDGTGRVDIGAQQGATADLKLRKAKDITTQLTNAEWMISAPGTEAQKSYLLNCVGCHTLERVFKSTHTADEFTQVMARMNQYAQVSQPLKPQKRMDPSYGENPERFRKPAEYFASINLSSGEEWSYPLKTLPRPSGRATRVVITEYALPRPTIEPHDVIVDRQGMAWYTDFGEEYLGKLDPKTGKVTEYRVPEFKPGFPQGSLELNADKTGKFWFGMMYQGAVADFDPKTAKFHFWPLPKNLNDNVAQLNMVTWQYGVDGKIWTNNAGPGTIFRLDLKSGKYQLFDPLASLPGGAKGHSIYGIAADSTNNLYMTEFQTNYLLRIDAKTGEVKYYETPTANSRPRRIRMDDQDRAWFAEYRGNKIGMLDTKTEQIKEWALPTPWTGPYYVVWDKQGELWTGGMTTDRVVRLDPKTEQTVEYLMPRDTNIRRVFVDESTRPVTFWTGSNHGASIVKVAPLD